MKYFAFGVALLLSSSTWGKDWNSLNALTLKNAQYKDQAAVCLLDSMGVEVNQNGSGSFLIRKIVRIDNPKGALAHRILKYDYDPLTAFAAFKRVTINKADGTAIEIDPQSAKDYAAPARAIYWGARQIMIELGRLDEGDIIDYEITKKGFTYALLANETNDEERFIPPMRGQFYDIVPFWVDMPTVKKVYRVALPKEKEVQYEFYQGNCSSSVRFEGDNKVYQFATTHSLPFKKEPNMIDLFDAAPKLFMSTTAHWEEKSRWFYNVNEDYGSFNATPDAQKKVDELIKGCKTEMDKIAVLTHWVADNMRYSGISMGKGEGYTLHNTEMNFTDRCGVCKDKAALLISMLRMAGFEAYAAMTMAGSRVETIPADHFNHSVTVVKLSNGTMIPLDPTWVPFLRELWSSAEQQQHYLPGTSEGSNIVLTPISAPENHYFRMKSNATLDKNGTLRGEFSVNAEGQSDKSVRNIFTGGFQTEWYNALERELLNISPAAILEKVEYGKDPKDYQAAPIALKFRFTIPNYATVTNNELFFKPLTLSGIYTSVRSYLRIAPIDNREYGFKDACSRLVELDETIQLPKGYKMIQGNKNDVLDNNAASFTGSIQQEGNTIKMNHTLATKKRVYEAAEAAGFNEAIKKHKSYGENYIIVVKQ